MKVQSRPMPEGELGVALAVLRAIRGWSQNDLAQASDVRSSSISNYERGKTVPGLRTLSRLVSAMGYPLSALDEARTFVYSVRAESALKGAVPRISGPRSVAASGTGPAPPAGERPAESALAGAALHWELEQVSAEAGRVVSRVARVILHLLAQSGHLPSPEPSDPPAGDGRDGGDPGDPGSRQGSGSGSSVPSRR